MSHGHVLRALREFGVVGTFKKLYKMRTLKFGRLVGVDGFGNHYYENTKDYPAGQHRWVEYAGAKSFYEVDASFVPPEWHGWLHCTTDEPPTATKVGSSWRTTPLPAGTGTSAPYARNLGGVVTAPTSNPTQYRPRGWGIGNGLSEGSAPHEERFYTQPGHILDPRNASRRPAGARRSVDFTLRDTPDTLLAKQAVRAGLSAGRFADLRDPASLAHTSLVVKADAVAGGGEVAAAAGAGAGGASSVRIAENTGSARTWTAAADAPTFGSALAERLSGAELAVLQSGVTEDDLLADVGEFQRYVESYAHVKTKDVQEAVAEAAEKRDAALARLALLRVAHEKAAALRVEFDGVAVGALADWKRAQLEGGAPVAGGKLV